MAHRGADLQTQVLGEGEGSEPGGLCLPQISLLLGQCESSVAEGIGDDSTIRLLEFQR